MSVMNVGFVPDLVSHGKFLLLVLVVLYDKILPSGDHRFVSFEPYRELVEESLPNSRYVPLRATSAVFLIEILAHFYPCRRGVKISIFRC
jgi:hypothetical protein